MKLLKDILYKISLRAVSGNTDLPVVSIQFDSRKVEKECLFVAVRGVQADGHQFIDKAIASGATAIMCEILPDTLTEGITYIEVADTGLAMGIAAANFYDNPSARLKLVGVTGTNGKTTCVTLLFNLFRALGYNTGLLSTVENKVNDQIIPATHTTPDSVSLNALLRNMLEQGCTHCFMEVSSHAVVQHRIAGLQFAGAVFTNITHDHLDYHGTFDEYIRAKKMFFDGLSSKAFALSNADDKRGTVMLQNTVAARNYFSLKTIAEFKARMLTNSFQGIELDIEGRDVWFRLTGSFNAYNLMAVYGTAVLLGEDREVVLTALSSLDGARGRFDQIVSTSGITAIIDYAHTPDALENVLNTIADIRDGNEQLITVVGCGGNRDAAKRPLMGGIAARLSDRVLLTSDNPRNEDPQDILTQMKAGISVSEQKKALTITDRKEAIRTAVMLAQKGDIILIAGKGHETYQEIQGIKHPFDDKKIVLELFNDQEK